jgi:iron complex transport system substrate-binding protein
MYGEDMWIGHGRGVLPCITRRGLLAALTTTAAASALPTFAAASRRIVSLDYGLASTLLSLGVVPVAISELADWSKWVVEPPMPAGVIDLGSSWEVNLESLAMLKPDLILSTPYLDDLKPKLEAIAPVLRVDVFSPDAVPSLTAAIAATRKLGSAVGRDAEAESFLAESDAFFQSCRQRLAGRTWPPLAFVVGSMEAGAKRRCQAPPAERKSRGERPVSALKSRLKWNGSR